MKTKILFLLPMLAILMTSVSALTVTVCDSGCDNTTLTDAITYATTGDSINVSSATLTGTYIVAEDLTIYTDTGAILNGGDSGVLMDIQAGGAGTTIDGFSFENAGTFIIQLSNAPAGVTITNNNFDMTGSATQGISVGAAGADSLVITDNTWTAMDAGDGGIWAPSIDNSNIEGNTFTGGGITSGYCIEVAGAGATTILDNIIDACSLGIAILNGDGSSTVDVIGNTVTNSKYGLYVAEYGTGGLSVLGIENNTFTDNTYGFRVVSSTYIDMSLGTHTYNVISGSTTAEIQYDDTPAMTFEYNYIANLSRILGSGTVDYYPYLLSADITDTKTMEDVEAVFTGTATTDFSGLTNWTDVNLVLENTKAKVEWADVDLRDTNRSFDLTVIFDTNIISVDSTESDGLNAPATITFYDTGYTRAIDMRIVKDGGACATCTFVSIIGENITFTVTDFSDYELVDSASNLNINALLDAIGGFFFAINQTTSLAGNAVASANSTDNAVTLGSIVILAMLVLLISFGLHRIRKPLGQLIKR